MNTHLRGLLVVVLGGDAVDEVRHVQENGGVVGDAGRVVVRYHLLACFMAVADKCRVSKCLVINYYGYVQQVLAFDGLERRNCSEETTYHRNGLIFVSYLFRVTWFSRKFYVFLLCYSSNAMFLSSHSVATYELQLSEQLKRGNVSIFRNESFSHQII